MKSCSKGENDYFLDSFGRGGERNRPVVLPCVFRTARLSLRFLHREDFSFAALGFLYRRAARVPTLSTTVLYTCTAPGLISAENSQRRLLQERIEPDGRWGSRWHHRTRSRQQPHAPPQPWTHALRDGNSAAEMDQ